jgi:hypothetical protein
VLFEHCLKAKLKVKKPFQLTFYLHKEKLYKTVEMPSRIGGQIKNSIKLAATESLN